MPPKPASGQKEEEARPGSVNIAIPEEVDGNLSPEELAQLILEGYRAKTNKGEKEKKVDPMPDVPQPDPSEDVVIFDKLMGNTDFPSAKNIIGLDFTRSDPEANLDPVLIDVQDTVGISGVTLKEALSKADDSFLKWTEKFKFDDQVLDLTEHATEIANMGALYGATERTCKAGLWLTIHTKYASLISDMQPLQMPYFQLSYRDYVDALRLRTSSVTEVKIAQRKYLVRRQETLESPTVYFYQKLKLYKRAYPFDRRDFTRFVEEFARRLTNPHLREYLVRQASSLTKEAHVLEAVNAGILYVVRSIESGLLSRREGYGLAEAKQVESVTEKNVEEARLATINILFDETSGKPEANDTIPSESVNAIKPGDKRAGEDDICFYCDKRGHFARDCYKKAKDVKSGTYVFKERPVRRNSNQIQGGEDSDSSETDSDSEFILNLMKNQRISRSQGRRILRNINRGRRASRAKSDQLFAVQAGPPTKEQGESKFEELTDNINLLATQVQDLSDKMTFLGVSYHQKGQHSNPKTGKSSRM